MEHHKTELCPAEIKVLLSRMPKFETSYEVHKQVSPPAPISSDQWCFYIPTGHKWFVWFSFRGKHNGLYWMELNRNRGIQRVFFQQAVSSQGLPLFYGTILYGTRPTFEEDGGATPFIIEDLFHYKGNFVHCLPELEKWTLIYQFLHQNPVGSEIRVPVICSGEALDRLPPYLTHHIQTRHLTKKGPFINWQVPKNTPFHKQPVVVPSLTNDLLKPVFKNWKKEQYRQDTVFSIQADPADDMYRMYVFGPNRTLLFYDFCFIPDYETSKKMNTLFRHVRENTCLDWIEESDDEDDPPPPLSDKHLLITCRFHSKFRKWIPLQIAATGSRVAHICQM